MSEQQYGIYYVEEIAPGAFKICERREASMYLVMGSTKACLIDTAFGLTDLKAFTRQFTELPVTVVNTHGHIDHVLGNHWFCGKGEEEVYLNLKDKDLYDEVVSEYIGMINDPGVQEQYGEFMQGFDPATVSFPKTKDIKEGDLIDLGGRTLEIVEIPGHTPGSILLLDKADKICYAGDSMIENLWLFLEESLKPEEYLASLKHARDILAAAGIERIYNGHFSDVPLTPEDIDNMIRGVETLLTGKAEGVPFENHAGEGMEYTFGEWKILCKQ